MTKKNKYIFTILLLFALTLSGCAGPSNANTQPEETTKAISFTDDDGKTIQLDKPCEKIISLYSAHTENLFTLGAGDKIIGVHKTSIYPPEAAFLPRFDYNGDPEAIIAAAPDLVLIRPFISRKSPDLINALTSAGIPVVSLYPDTFEEFDNYIHKLALLTGTEATANIALSELHKDIQNITTLTETVTDKKSIFFESTEVELRTATPDSMVGKAIAFAGGKNIAANAKPFEKGSSIASFGEEKIIAAADDIDVYVSQRGAMNAGGNEHSIPIRPGFDTIKAVKEGKVFIINEKIISSPTFRYNKGVMELSRFLYPELMDTVEEYKNDNLATRRDFANLLVKCNHLPIFVTASSKYYEKPHKGHIYGMFEDIPWTDSDFDVIETAVQSGLIPWEMESEKQFFHPDTPVTKEEVAKAIFILQDYKRKENHKLIADLAECESPNMIQSLVDNNIFTLKDKKFEPKKELTNKEIIEILEQIK